ncbi:MAG TPA: hypothetical protein VF581_08825 [Flavobacterium sp.]|jgi:hypothetical protein
MRKVNLFKGTAIMLSIATLSISCSNDSAVENYSIDNISNMQRAGDLAAAQRMLTDMKSQFKVNSNAEIISIDDDRPALYTDYLQQLNMSNIVVNTVNHIVLDTKTDVGLIDIYTFQYSQDSSKVLTIYEGKSFDRTLAYDISYNFTTNNMQLVSSTSYLLNNYSVGAKFSMACFKTCMSHIMSSDTTIGATIWVLGIAGGAGCVPCGAAAAVYAGFGTLGCAGGCNK